MSKITKVVYNANGEHEAKIYAAKAMLADGVDINLIVKYTGLSVEKLKTESGKWEAEN